MCRRDWTVALVREPLKEKENSDFYPAVLHLKDGLV